MGVFIIVAFVVGFAVGLATAMFWYGTTRARIEEQLRAAQTTATDLQGRLAQQAIETNERGLEIVRLNQEVAIAKTIALKQQEAFDKAEKALKESFVAMAQEALRGNSEQFIQLARSKFAEQQQEAAHALESRKKEVEQLVKPISEELGKFQQQVQQLERQREGAYSGITEQLKMVASAQHDLRTETSRLVGALKTPIHRGRWGEVQLRRVVELAGMVEHCDFEEQPTYATEEGRQRPDLVVHLPGGREIVVDAKVSLNAYLEASGAESETERAEKFKQHAAQVKAHVLRLASKAYWQQLDATPEFVVAFLPGESLLSAALQYDGSLIEFGAEQKVVLATPTTLIALLKAVAYGWRQEHIQENAKQISALGQMLYERLSTMYEHFSALRKNLDASVNAFNRMVGTLETRVMVSARKFRELGAAPSDDIEAIEPIETATRELTEPKAVQLKIRSIAAGASED
jgi:DNA recombination protein RmuC